MGDLRLRGLPRPQICDAASIHDACAVSNNELLISAGVNKPLKLTAFEFRNLLFCLCFTQNFFRFLSDGDEQSGAIIYQIVSLFPSDEGDPSKRTFNSDNQAELWKHFLIFEFGLWIKESGIDFQLLMSAMLRNIFGF